MSRHRVFRFSVLLLAVCALLWTGATAQAVGIYGYQVDRSFSLPAPGAGSGGNVLFDALPDGRLLLLNGPEVSVETAPKSASFTSLGTIPGFTPGFGPSFLAVSPDGTSAAAGSNGAGYITVFATDDPSSATNLTSDDFSGEWIDNRYLAIASGLSAPPGVSVLDTQTGTDTRVIANIGGASAGVTVDAAGNLYTGNGFSYGTGTSQTGWIKAFAAADWQNALATNTPLEFESSGTPVADLLSAYPIGFDSSGNMFVGGADFFGGSGDLGFAALVDAGAVSAALASPQATPPIDPSSPANVLRKIPSPQSAIDALAPPNWVYNRATGELLLNYIYGDGTVTVYSVPEPHSLMLFVAGVLLVMARRAR